MADVYLRQIAAREPAVAPELTQAGQLYAEEHDLAAGMQAARLIEQGLAKWN